MARLTSNMEEIHRLSKLINSGGINKPLLQIKLLDGTFVEGATRSSNIGNNARENGYWAYYGEITIQNIDGSKYLIDLLDVEYILDIWKSHHQQYNEAGIIEIVNFPKS